MIILSPMSNFRMLSILYGYRQELFIPKYQQPSAPWLLSGAQRSWSLPTPASDPSTGLGLDLSWIWIQATACPSTDTAYSNTEMGWGHTLCFHKLIAELNLVSVYFDFDIPCLFSAPAWLTCALHMHMHAFCLVQSMPHAQTLEHQQLAAWWIKKWYYEYQIMWSENEYILPKDSQNYFSAHNIVRLKDTSTELPTLGHDDTISV